MRESGKLSLIHEVMMVLHPLSNPSRLFVYISQLNTFVAGLCVFVQQDTLDYNGLYSVAVAMLISGFILIPISQKVPKLLWGITSVLALSSVLLATSCSVVALALIGSIVVSMVCNTLWVWVNCKYPLTAEVRQV